MGGWLVRIRTGGAVVIKSGSVINSLNSGAECAQQRTRTVNVRRGGNNY